MDGTDLTLAGIALYGTAWKGELRQALGVSDREYRRWIAGSSPIPPGVVGGVRAMLVARQEKIARILDEWPKPGEPRG